jgi:hypothetical protein
MPRYFLHLHGAGGIVPDEEGALFPNEEAAHRSAVKAIRELMAADVSRGVLDLGGRIVIEDEAGEPVRTVCCRDAVKVVAG